MFISYSLNDNFSQVEVADDIDIETFLALIVMDNPLLERVPRNNLIFVANGRKIQVSDGILKEKLTDFGIANNDMILIYVAPPSTSSAPSSSTASTRGTVSSGTSGSSSVQGLFSNLVKGIKVPKKRETLEEQVEKMLKRVDSKDFESEARQVFAQLKDQLAQHRYKEPFPTAVETYLKDNSNFQAFLEAMRADQKAYCRRLVLTNDPTSAEGQALIADIIKKEYHQNQFKQAMTDMPEAFVRHMMLYIKIKINGKDFIGFLDTGAQVTTMTEAHVAHCNYNHKIDKSFGTYISGIGGTQISKGRIHSVDFELNGRIIKAPVQVFERVGEEVLIGLDTLRRHDASIDLVKNCLRLGKDGVDVPFLTEQEYIDECQRLGLKCNMPATADTPIPLDDVDSEKLAHLVDMGYDIEEARKSLAKARNNLVAATEFLETDEGRQKAGIDEPMDQA